ncbi:MAG TPA: serine/threonine-protein kinase, partial [Pirellulales bacterium]|nr:serine/threonine-protein kinase [Pirellulales bacterium]
MFDEPRVQQLLDEILDAGLTPEDVCQDCPELLTEVRQRWRQMRHVEARLDQLFPSSDVIPDDDNGAARHTGTPLPTIPGYEVEGVLGRGGMGIVYKACQVRLNRPVALKMLLAGAYAAPGQRERFAREAEAVGGLKHPSIVQVYDVGDHEGLPFLTMEYVEGGSLADVLLGQPRPAQQAAAMLITLTEAVRVAHRDGVVHRDLKPANILLGSDGTPKIADFGLARHFNAESSLTLSGARLGTPSYMAPEQARGELSAVGPASDIYSLGAILYELLTGRPPFRGETSTETTRQAISGDPVAPTLLNRQVPRDLETICLKCLHKEPQGRYTSAAALADDLNRFQRGEPIRARPATPLERLSKWARRRPAQATTLAASLVVSMGLVAAGLWFVDQQTQQRNAIEADLRDVARLRDSARWADARLALKRAESRPGLVVTEDLRQRLGQARRDFDLVAELDGIRLNRVTHGELDFYKVQADKNYAETFRRAGLDGFDEESGSVARKINASAARAAL